jgi:hypothetical protein
MRRATVLRLLVVESLLTGFGQAPLVAQNRWARAESLIVRLSPADFPDVPDTVRNHLVELGCSIPQGWGDPDPHNVVSGRFASPEQTDWAALCSRDGTSAVVVLWGGPVACPAPLAPMPDRNFLQDLGQDGIHFSRGLSAIPADRLSRHWTPSGDAPPQIGRDALADAFFEKGATAYYCHEGRWLEFTAGDF